MRDKGAEYRVKALPAALEAWLESPGQARCSLETLLATFVGQGLRSLIALVGGVSAMNTTALPTAGRFLVRRKRPNRPAVDNARARHVASTKCIPVHSVEACHGAGPVTLTLTVRARRGVSDRA